MRIALGAAAALESDFSVETTLEQDTFSDAADFHLEDEGLLDLANLPLALSLASVPPFSGRLEGKVTLECSRCAKRYPHSLRDEFRLMLEPEQGREPTDPEGERGLAESGVCLGEDLEAGWFRGPVIRLDDFFGEVIALTMPLQPLCNEDCRGICSHCGVDLAVTQCDCADEQIDSPFAVLAKLKGESKDE
jgi:uncharacterized metal-binding protein YceD (DUF177 family)